MEVKLVHPDDTDQKVVTATDEVQVEAYRSVGFVTKDELKARGEAAKEEANQLDELTKRADAAEKKAEEETKARQDAEKRADAAEKELAELKKKKQETK